jgi:DNA-binding MurR/RpiR family transcriptional regulator
MMPLKDEIFARMDELSPAERKVARTLLASYPSAGLESAAAVAKTAGTSTPTVLRLVTRLGIGSYPEFQRRLREEITQRMSSPVSRAERSATAGEGSLLERAVEQRARLVDRLLSSVPPSEFDRAVRLLAAGPKHVVVSGGYFSRHIAYLLTMQLDQLIPGVDLAEEPLGRDIGRYLRVGKDSVVVVIDLRRYELISREVTALAKQRRATVIVITDEGLSPAAEDADVVLPVTIDGIPFDSFAGLLVLVEALVEGVFHAVGATGLQRMKDWEESVHIYRALRADAGLPRGLAGDDERG